MDNVYVIDIKSKNLMKKGYVEYVSCLDVHLVLRVERINALSAGMTLHLS